MWEIQNSKSLMLFINSTERQGQEIKIFFSSDSNTIPLCEVAKKLEIANLGKISGERYASKYFILLKISLSWFPHSNSPHTAILDDEQDLFHLMLAETLRLYEGVK